MADATAEMGPEERDSLLGRIQAARAAEGSDAAFVEAHYEARIRALLEGGEPRETRLRKLGDLAREILRAGIVELESSLSLQRRLAEASKIKREEEERWYEAGRRDERLDPLDLGTTPIRRSFELGDVRDPELQAARILVELLEPLDVGTRLRLLSWASDRFSSAGDVEMGGR